MSFSPSTGPLGNLALRGSTHLRHLIRITPWCAFSATPMLRMGRTNDSFSFEAHPRIILRGSNLELVWTKLTETS